MFIVTDSIRGLLSELASAGHMEVELDGERLRVTVDCGDRTPRCVDARSSRLIPKEPSAPRLGNKPGPKSAPKYRKVNGRRQRVFSYKGEDLTIQEWAERYGTTVASIDYRFRHHGSPELIRHSKTDKNSLKSRLGDATEGGAR